MRNTIRKYKFIAVSVFIIALLFVEACNKSTSTITEKIVKPKPLKGELVLWCNKYDEAILSSIARSFEDKNHGVKIDILPVNETKIEEKLQKLRDSGDTKNLPHVVEVNTEQVSYLVNEIPEIFKNITAPHTDILRWKLKETSVDGENYAVPWNTDPKVMLYNADLLKKYNIDPFNIKTWDDLAEYGKKLNGHGIKMFAEYSDGRNNNLLSVMLREQDLNVYNDENEIDIDEDKLYRILAQQKLLYQRGIVDKSGDQKQAIDKLMKGRAAAMIADESIIAAINSDSKYKNHNWQIERLPAFEPGGKNSACGYGKAFMRTNSPDNDIAGKFIQYVMGDREINREIVSQKGYITSSSDVYIYSYFNAGLKRFNNKKLFRFMSEVAEEEKPVIFGSDYSKIMRQISSLAQRVIDNDNKKISDSEMIEKQVNDLMNK
ncbi:ABC transporter substrate-binding protein [Clostridium oryzae]|uniref:Lactose-binding protein n=1 Tax=Clostridium oryzae TaxID=1450648 RepID=A0A1V4ITK8_9CLOT|nr:extracellular solute-binding protein [Clostridium oryzae]OPJ63368.1 lactose-binding protein precursor [Clostridium oryzae]